MLQRKFFNYKEDEKQESTKKSLIKLKRDLQDVQKFLDDTKVEYTREDIRELLFNNLREHYIALSLEDKMQGRIHGDWNTSDAGVWSMSVDDIPSEVVEVVYKVLNEVENTPFKSLSLYMRYGIYANAIKALFKKYPEYHVKELFQQKQAKGILNIYNVALKRVEAGYDGNKSVWQLMKSMKIAGEMLEITTDKEEQQVVGQGGITLNLNVNGERR